jgi:hypothetical protein
MGFFDLNLKKECGAGGRASRTLTYDEIPTYFWWNSSDKMLKPRKTVDLAVGQLFSISYLAREKFFFFLFFCYIAREPVLLKN